MLSNEKSTRLGFRVTDILRERLDYAVKATGSKSISSLVIKILEQWLDSNGY